ncbi:zinc finger domain-containing protein [Streptomyces odonnellii]|uniref:zinc finger domain-containing protein n=1 Tax=Streptomyces odonnellii TaxID=1417980 RepID=UPI000626EC46|nr:hypothetical protein [Streptomyces odonnellii]
MNRRLRFPQMAVTCTWCHAPAGDLCTNPSTGRLRGHDTHDIRRRTWVIDTTTCTETECEAAPGSPCTTSTGIPLTTHVHPVRDDAAHRAYAAQHAHDQQLSLPVGASRLDDHDTR